MKARDLEKGVERAEAALRAGGAPSIGAAIVLGSGLGAFADEVESPVAVPYGDVPGLAVSTVEGHAGRFVFGTLAGLTLGVMQGRVHLYEGFPPEQVVLPIRALARLGAKVLVLTNASGAVSERIDAGDLVVVSDHLNLTGRNPLVGPNPASLGPRFPDMQNAYDPRLRELATEAAADVGVRIAQGVYACMLGPSYETPAEVRMAATLGADLVGMSTVPEVIAARHAGLRVLAISCATNRAAGRPGAVLDHEHVQRTARQAQGALIALLRAVVLRLAREVAP